MSYNFIKKAFYLIILLTTNLLLFSEGVALDEWQFSLQLNAPQSEWKSYSLKQAQKSHMINLSRGESIFYRTSLPAKALNSILSSRENIEIFYEKLDMVRAVYLNGTAIFYSEKPAYLNSSRLPIELIKEENELVIELHKSYRSPDNSPFLARPPQIYSSIQLSKLLIKKNSINIVLALCFLITGLFLATFINRRLKNYDFLLFSLLCFTFFIDTLIDTPLVTCFINSSGPIIKALNILLVRLTDNYQPIIGLYMYCIMFREESPLIKNGCKIMAYWATGMCLVNLILDIAGIVLVSLYNYLFIPFIVVIFILYIYIIARAVKRRVSGIIYFVAGQTIFILAWIVQLLGEFGPLPQTNLYLQIGFFIYIYSIGFYLAKHFLRISLDLQELSLNLNEKVKERTQELKESYLQKSNFFINMTHETKTPVMLVKNYLELHIGKQGSSSELDIAYRNACELERNMDNYMQLEKAADREQELYRHEQTINLTELLEEIVKLYPVEQIKASLESELYIKANPAALKRIVDNILSNSLKYNGLDVEITIELKAKGDRLILMIADNGVGIELEQQKDIFTPFYQASTNKMNIQGVGLGLSLVKLLVDSLKGRIELKSAPAAGTAFTIILMRAERPGDDDTGELLELPPLPPAPLPGREPAVVDSNYIHSRESLLIIEDKRDTLYLLKTLLETEYNIFVASNGAQALLRLEELKDKNRLPDLIISDIMMDNIDGYRFISLVKEREEFSYIPVIFLTAKSTKKDESRAYSGGAVAYLTKPFSAESLRGVVRANIESRESLLDDFEKSRYNLHGFYSRCDDFGLTEVKKEILKQWVLEDIPQAIIADNLKRKLRTVEKHIKEIKEATGVKTERNAKSALKLLFKEYIN